MKCKDQLHYEKLIVELVSSSTSRLISVLLKAGTLLAAPLCVRRQYFRVAAFSMD